MPNKKNGLSRYRIEKVVRCCCAELTASQAALLLGLNRKTVNWYLALFRAAIAALRERDLAAFSGGVEVDESFFAAERVRGLPGPGKRGRGTLKQPVLGIFERARRVCTEVIPDTIAPTLRPIIRARIALDAVLVTDGWPGYNGLVDVVTTVTSRNANGDGATGLRQPRQRAQPIDGLESCKTPSQAA